MQVCRKDEFLKLSLEDVKSYLSSEQLNVGSEFEVYEGAVSWLAHKQQRCKYVLEVLDLVRLPLLDTKQLLTDVGQNPLVLGDPRLVKMLMDAVQCNVLPDFKANVSYNYYIYRVMDPLTNYYSVMCQCGQIIKLKGTGILGTGYVTEVMCYVKLHESSNVQLPKLGCTPSIGGFVHSI